MPKVTWDAPGEKTYETGVDRGMLYIPTNGIYNLGYAWNGLTAVTQSPSGAEPTPMWADNIKYLNILSREDFNATVEALMYPNEFAQCDGSAQPSPGVFINQQARRTFGMSYRTLIGDDQVGTARGYKINLIYGALAAPSEKAHATVNDTPEGVTFSWELSTTEVNVTGYKPTASITIDSTKVSAANLAALELLLYGDPVGAGPSLPSPDQVIAIFAGGIVSATPVMPTFTAGTGALVIPTTTGITYRNSQTMLPITGTITVPVASSYQVVATPNTGYKLASGSDDDWTFTRP